MCMQKMVINMILIRTNKTAMNLFKLHVVSADLFYETFSNFAFLQPLDTKNMNLNHYEAPSKTFVLTHIKCRVLWS